EMVMWAAREFAFLRATPALGAGSSLMPQKRNPDVAELVRGKTGRIVGDLVSLLTTLKGLPLGYNRDLQEDKAPVFDALDQVLATLDAVTTAVSTLEFDEDRLDVRTSLSRRKTHGGPSPKAVRAQLVRAHDAVGLQRYSLSKHAECVELVDSLLSGAPR